MESNHKVALSVVVGFVGLLLLLWLNPFVTVDQSEMALVLRNGKYNRTLDSGLHWRTPIIEDVYKYDTRQQAETVSADAASKDLQSLSTTVTVNYLVEGQTIDVLYREIGQAKDYKLKVIDPSVQEAVKAATAFYTAEEAITKRESVKADIGRLLREAVYAKAGALITVKDISITNFKFSPEFDQAIENKVKAQQMALQAENDLKRVEFEAKQKVAQAEAEARSTQLISDAANNEKYIQLKQLEVQLELAKKYQGGVPQTLIIGSGTNGSIPAVFPFPVSLTK